MRSRPLLLLQEACGLQRWNEEPGVGWGIPPPSLPSELTSGEVSKSGPDRVQPLVAAGYGAVLLSHRQTQPAGGTSHVPAVRRSTSAPFGVGSPPRCPLRDGGSQQTHRPVKSAGTHRGRP